GGYVAQFAQLVSAAGAAEPVWMTGVRRRAMDAFEERGFPTTRDEEWRFTSVAPIAGTQFVPASEHGRRFDKETLAPLADLAAYRLPSAAAELVLVNGRYAPELSTTAQLPAGTRVESLASALRSPQGHELEPYLAKIAAFENQPFTALNTALWTDGAWLSLPPRSVIDAPIHVMFVPAPGGSERDGAKPTVAHPRV